MAQRTVQRSGLVIPHVPRWHQRVAAAGVAGLIRVMGVTLRKRVEDHSGFFDGRNEEQAIYCFWHNRLALCTVAYNSYMRKHRPGRRIAGLVSASRDGGWLTAVLEQFEIQPVRGSSSRRGRQALLELTRWAGRGYDLAITPDGPRGPCYEVQEGVLALAQVTGLPIIPFSYELDWKIRVNSWDRFQIPVPFSRFVLRLGKPVRVPRHATDAERETLRGQLQSCLRRLSGNEDELGVFETEKRA